MSRLPDFEAWAVFAKVAELGSFSRAATDLSLSKATVSKLVSRLEAKLGIALFHRTSRRLSLSQSGTISLERATRILAEGEAIEAEATAQSSAPQGLVRLAAPMSFGIMHLAPALQEFFILYPDIMIDLSLDDSLVDLVSDGFDLALRISALADSSLLARRLCSVRILLVGSPDYFDRRGRPHHPSDLLGHTGLRYTNTRVKNVWRFAHDQQGDYSVFVSGPLSANNADAFRPALIAGIGVALQPEFLVWDDLAQGRLEAVMPEWKPPGISVHLVTPPNNMRPRRVQTLIDFLGQRFSKASWSIEQGRENVSQRSTIRDV